MLDAISIGRERAVPGAHEVAAQHLRLDLVAQIPERPRRFLLRLALGYSYDEISAAEGVSHTTTNRQIARAKRILRDLDASANATGDDQPPATTLPACRRCCPPTRVPAAAAKTTKTRFAPAGPSPPRTGAGAGALADHELRDPRRRRAGPTWPRRRRL
jgi:hypothetical protein